MALIICIECGREFSSYASTCPKCGCPTNIAMGNGSISTDEKPVKFIEEPSNVEIESIPNVNSLIDHDNDSNRNEEEKGVLSNTVNDLKVKKPIKKTGTVLIIIVLLGVAIGLLYLNPYNNPMILNEIKNTRTNSGDTVEEEIYKLLNNTGYVRTFGWQQKYIGDGIFFVSYEFDTDMIDENGYHLFAYEYNRNLKIVRSITTSSALKWKYKNLGLIE